MNPGGLVLIALGGLVLAQLFGGHALERLNILHPSVPGTPVTNQQYGTGTYPDGSQGPAPAGPDLPPGPILGPGGQAPVAPNPPTQPAGLTLVG